MHNLRREVYYKQNCIEDGGDYLELYVTPEGNLNLENIGAHSVIMDIKGAKKLRKTLKKYIKSEEEN